MVKESHSLIGDGYKVELGQEYRLLVYDRMLDEYGFIALRERREPFHTSLAGKELDIIRYSPETAYVFRISQNYPTFPQDSRKEAIKWAEDNCLEKRAMPHWWRTDSDTYEKYADHVGDVVCPKDCYDYGYDGDYAMNYNYQLAAIRRKQDLNYHI